MYLTIFKINVVFQNLFKFQHFSHNQSKSWIGNCDVVPAVLNSAFPVAVSFGLLCCRCSRLAVDEKLLNCNVLECLLLTF